MLLPSGDQAGPYMNDLLPGVQSASFGIWFWQRVAMAIYIYY